MNYINSYELYLGVVPLYFFVYEQVNKIIYYFKIIEYFD